MIEPPVCTVLIIALNMIKYLLISSSKINSVTTIQQLWVFIIMFVPNYFMRIRASQFFILFFNLLSRYVLAQITLPTLCGQWLAFDNDSFFILLLLLLLFMNFTLHRLLFTFQVLGWAFAGRALAGGALTTSYWCTWNILAAALFVNSIHLLCRSLIAINRLLIFLLLNLVIGRCVDPFQILLFMLIYVLFDSLDVKCAVMESDAM